MIFGVFCASHKSIPQGSKEKRVFGFAISNVFCETNIFQEEKHIDIRETNLMDGSFMSLPW